MRTFHALILPAAVAALLAPSPAFAQDRTIWILLASGISAEKQTQFDNERDCQTIAHWWSAAAYCTPFYYKHVPYSDCGRACWEPTLVPGMSVKLRAMVVNMTTADLITERRRLVEGFHVSPQDEALVIINAELTKREAPSH
jgi:hypothetical protein